MPGKPSQDLSRCLIGSSRTVNPIFDQSAMSVYSIDMVRFDVRFNPSQVDAIHKLVDTWITKRTFYYASNKIGGFRNMWKLEYDQSSITVGTCHVTGTGKTDAGRGFIEANPNKVGKKLVALINKLLGMGAKIEPVRYDLAIDYPIERDTVRLLKDNRKYGCIMSESFTEYLGQRNKAGFVKVYDKQAESNLDAACTRVELTCSADWTPEQVLKHLPTVFTYASNEFESLKRTTKAYAVAVQAHLANGDALEPWLALCDPKTRTKLRKAFGEQRALEYSLKCITETMKYVEMLANGTWETDEKEKGSDMLFNFNQDKCPLCGSWHDDGYLIERDGKKEFLCLDCGEHYLEAHEVRRQAGQTAADLGQMNADTEEKTREVSEMPPLLAGKLGGTEDCEVDPAEADTSPGTCVGDTVSERDDRAAVFPKSEHDVAKRWIHVPL